MGDMLHSEIIDTFRRDGFVIIRNLLDDDDIAAARDRFEPLFKGKFETGLYPDEWNWQEGRDPADRTRQICNGWKSDRTIARIVLSPKVGELCARLGGWPGARMGQDNVLWKPPGAKSLGFHQDDSYCHWVVPAGYITCWMTLDDTAASGGTIEYARGSHLWPLSPPMGKFHAPDDYHASLREAAAHAGREIEIVPIEVRAGDAVIHHGRTWHGSGPNRETRPRRSLVAHCLSSEARFHPTEVSYIYSRYRRRDDLAMDESYFPILWRADGYRSPWLARYLDLAPAAE
ncbi:ectoine hydroxylase-related dioxygenase (phytanoyl-CoA dioxygenase family) [Dongia mobilis]|uniref:Ectoine hydroxylase-related dioxygenase (Phytanoyl-CoA dioxygenase family) n=2 Tax=Dongia mobilis TaxID=578943 RepID=A0A4R6WY12_9PROT|nr:ectoine hydroxylase-related dioxygenase (phytanoyl-CoA dioxygenase family) [Dongia mobilis]